MCMNVKDNRFNANTDHKKKLHCYTRIQPLEGALTYPDNKEMSELPCVGCKSLTKESLLVYLSTVIYIYLNITSM